MNSRLLRDVVADLDSAANDHESPAQFRSVWGHYLCAVHVIEVFILSRNIRLYAFPSVGKIEFKVWKVA